MDMQDTDFAYLAGILDGEGTVTIRKNLNSFQPQISIQMPQGIQ